MIRVQIDVIDPRDGRSVGYRVITIGNMGPAVPDEGWDPGGERVYGVETDGGFRTTVTHFRRDGMLPLIVKALGVLPR